jgi:hypothetical protein
VPGLQLAPRVLDDLMCGIRELLEEQLLDRREHGLGVAQRQEFGHVRDRRKRL